MVLQNNAPPTCLTWTHGQLYCDNQILSNFKAIHRSVHWSGHYWPIASLLSRQCYSWYVTHHFIYPTRVCLEFRMGPYTRCTLIARFMGPTWGPSGADRTQVGPCWPHELCYLGNTVMGEILSARRGHLTKIYLFRRLLNVRSEIALANFECHWPVWEVLKNNQ